MSEVTIFGKGNRLTFGKYKGMLIDDIVALDPDYLVWAHNNITWFEMEESLLEDVMIALGNKPLEDRTPQGQTIKEPPRKAAQLFDSLLDDTPF
jgi:uncharacterized protein (DUF3820 family)